MLLKSLDNPRLSPIINHKILLREITFLVNYKNEGSLEDLINKKPKNSLFSDKLKGLTEKKAFYYFADILAGLRFLHKNNIHHGNLKPSNVIIGDSDRLELSDYGFSSLQKKINLFALKKNEIDFIAPEVH